MQDLVARAEQISAKEFVSPSFDMPAAYAMCHTWLKDNSCCSKPSAVLSSPTNALECDCCLQDVLFKKNFSALPGLNSPARLIREMVKPDIADAV